MARERKFYEKNSFFIKEIMKLERRKNGE